MATPNNESGRPTPEPTVNRFTRGMWVVTIVLSLLLLASLAGLASTFLVGRFPAISVHGWIAMGLGTVFSLAIGCGLMWLSFFSARHGFDDRADPGRRRP